MFYQRLIQYSIFPILAIILAATFVSDGQRLAKRAKCVKAQPTTVTCAELVDDGPPENRHVAVTGFRPAKNYAISWWSDTERWAYVLVPLYPDSVQQDDQGETVKVVARIRGSGSDKTSGVVDDQQLQELLAQKELTGCLWDNDPAWNHFGRKVAEQFPKFNAEGYHVLFVGQELPTSAEARKTELIGYALYVSAALMAVFFGRKLYLLRRFRHDQAWLEGQASRDEPHPSDKSFAGYHRPSELYLKIKKWTLLTGFASPAISIVIYLCTDLGLIPQEPGIIGASSFMVLMFVCIAAFMRMGKRFVEQTYEPRERSEIRRGVLKYFESKGNELEECGFVRLATISVVDTIRIPIELWLHKRGAYLVSLEHAGIAKGYNFYSIAEDGTLLHTTSVDLNRGKSALPSLCVWSQSSQIRTGFTTQLNLVDKYRRKGQECACIDPVYATGIIDLAHRISGWSLQEYGIKKTNLPAIPSAKEMLVKRNGSLWFEWRYHSNVINIPNEVRSKLRLSSTGSLICSSPIGTREYQAALGE